MTRQEMIATYQPMLTSPADRLAEQRLGRLVRTYRTLIAGSVLGFAGYVLLGLRLAAVVFDSAFVRWGIADAKTAAEAAANRSDLYLFIPAGILLRVGVGCLYKLRVGDFKSRRVRLSIAAEPERYSLCSLKVVKTLEQATDNGRVVVRALVEARPRQRFEVDGTLLLQQRPDFVGKRFYCLLDTASDTIVEVAEPGRTQAAAKLTDGGRR